MEEARWVRRVGSQPTRALADAHVTRGLRTHPTRAKPGAMSTLVMRAWFLVMLALAGGCAKKDRHREMYLREAARQGDMQQVQWLLARGASVNARTTWGSPPPGTQRYRPTADSEGQRLKCRRSRHACASAGMAPCTRSNDHSRGRLCYRATGRGWAGRLSNSQGRCRSRQLRRGYAEGRCLGRRHLPARGPCCYR